MLKTVKRTKAGAVARRCCLGLLLHTALMGISLPALAQLFTEDIAASASLTGVYVSSLAWGDYDNDGDLDLVLTGSSNEGHISRLYRNDNGSFNEVNAGLTALALGSLAWGDYDNDGDLDLVLTGSTGSSPIAKLYRNNSAVANTTPLAPAGLSASTNGASTTLSWSAASDEETPAGGLSYNLIVGTASASPDVKSPMACRGGASCGGDGFRKIVAFGNAGQRTSYTIQGLAPGTYSWSVQTLDHAFAGSPFAAEGSFTIGDEEPSPEALLAELTETVQALSIQKGLKTALLSTLTDAQTSLQSGDLQSTLDALTAFINQCQSQRSKKLAKNTADGLIADARAIIDVLEAETLAGKTAALASPEASGLMPEQFMLEANYPNPFNPSTEIAFRLPETAKVRLVVYDVLGREVARLVDGALAAGQHRVRFEAAGLSSGTYLYRLEAGAFVQVRRMVLLK